MKQFKNLTEALNGDLKITKGRNGEIIAEVQTLETEKLKLFNQLNSQDSSIRELQNLTRKYKNQIKKNGSASIITSTVEVDTTVKTKTVVQRDTVEKGVVTLIYPEYSAQIELGKWINAEIVANKDSVELGLSVHNEYSVIIGEKKERIFKRKQSFAQVTNYNPYAEDVNVITYNVKTPKPKRFGFGISAGYALTSDFKFQPYIGIGANYNIIEIK